MPYLSAERRRKLPKSAFGMPAERKYPILVPGQEKEFAESALRLRGRGHGMDSKDRARIIRMASKVLYGKGVSTDAALEKLRDEKESSREKSPSDIKKRMENRR